MTDIQIAKANLDGHTICLCRDGNCIYSRDRGIAPMMNFIESGLELGGYSVADVVVGKAVALLFIKCGIKSVFAKTISEYAKTVLERFGIEYEYEVLTDKIINRDGTDICPMEKSVINTDEPFAAYEILKQKLKELKKA